MFPKNYLQTLDPTVDGWRRYPLECTDFGISWLSLEVFAAL